MNHVVEQTKLCADRGWRATFRMKSGEIVEAAYITGTNWDVGVVSIEKIGERHLPPRLIKLEEVTTVDIVW